MAGNQFAQFAELEDQLRAALIALDNEPKLPQMTKTAQKKLIKAARKRPSGHLPLVRAFARIVVSCRKPWGGHPVRIDYEHTNCSMFEAELAVDRMIRERGLTLPVVLTKEVCERRILSC